MHEELWFGTEHSYDVYATAMAKPTPNAREKSELEKMLPPLYERNESVGVVNIQGSLVQGSAGFFRLFGVTGYEDIEEALMEGLKDQKAKSLILNVGSGGGHVAGIMETSDLIQEIGKHKPVVTHSGTMMASAALWLGASANVVLASQLAEVGSIGVLMIHAERSRMLDNEGIKVTVIRSGKYKALGNPYEPLSEDAKAEMQKKGDYMEDLFMTHMAKMRGTSKEAGRAAFGEGRMFVGEQAVKVGLIDQVTNFQGAINVAKAVQK